MVFVLCLCKNKHVALSFTVVKKCKVVLLVPDKKANRPPQCQN